MSEKPPHEPQATPDAPKKPDTPMKDVSRQQTRRDDSNVSGLKWLAGAAVAALLVGGGYYALKNTPASQPGAEVAATETPPATPSLVAPRTVAGSQSTDQVAPALTTASTETTTASTAPARRRAATSVATAPEAVPEQVVGISDTSAEYENADEIVVTAGRRPVWSATPSARRLSAYYPARALERGREGEASVHCTVLVGGSLDCLRASEAPANSGFGLAALRVASKFRHAPQRADGRDAVGTPVNLRVVFRIADGDRRRG